jgi:hypothetical protein
MVMINGILDILREKLETVLQIARPRPESWVVVTNPTEQDGSLAEGANNKVVMSVVSIQADATMGAFAPAAMSKDNGLGVSSAPLHVDVYVLVMGHFSGINYGTGLEMISRSISYFQENPVFESESAPRLPSSVGKLVLEFVSLDFSQANNLLMLMGLQCFPFVLYRIRRLAFDSRAISAVAPPVLEADVKLAASAA